jgi:hypothetical protein
MQERLEFLRETKHSKKHVKMAYENQEEIEGMYKNKIHQFALENEKEFPIRPRDIEEVEKSLE